MRTLALLATLLFALPARADEKTAIQTLLQQQVAAWNQKDLAGYMAGYWKSPELTFFSGGTVTRGWQQTFDRYKARYQSPGAEMGTLAFTDLTVEVLSPGAALARGGWHLAPSTGKNLDGLFTVILRKLPEGWRIVHDHSSL